MREREESGLESVAPEADVQEQRRPLVEEGFDPEQTTRARPPDGSDAEADPADAHDQVVEVEADDEEYPPA